LFQDIGGGIELLQKGGKNREKEISNKMNTLTPCNDHQSIDSKDNKSVKSVKSLGDRLLRRAGKTMAEKQTASASKQTALASKQKHSNSLANIL
jgi:hypothetical protein